MDSHIFFYILLFIVAFLYSSVGHGGASGYLALMAIYGVTPEVMKPTALMLNLFVAGTSFIQFYRGRHFNWKIFFPLAIASIPLAFLGGTLSIDSFVYKKILGVLLLFPIARFLFLKDNRDFVQKPSNPWLSIVIGGSIGMLSGLIGIGGGIILSPILILLHWTNQKKTAAISALFIFVNSLGGLAGQLSKGIQFSPSMYIYVAVAFTGGLAGAYYGSLKFSQEWLKKILAMVLLLASYKLLFTTA